MGGLILLGSLKSCEASVVRYGDGSATVELRIREVKRRILFVKGKPTASDSSEAFTFSRKGDVVTVRFGDEPTESYMIPDALVYGG